MGFSEYTDGVHVHWRCYPTVVTRENPPTVKPLCAVVAHLRPSQAHSEAHRSLARSTPTRGMAFIHWTATTSGSVGVQYVQLGSTATHNTCDALPQVRCPSALECMPSTGTQQCMQA
jgi:hypothetical protein